MTARQARRWERWHQTGRVVYQLFYGLPCLALPFVYDLMRGVNTHWILDLVIGLFGGGLAAMSAGTTWDEREADYLNLKAGADKTAGR